jgi:hypothetical protein
LASPAGAAPASGVAAAAERIKENRCKKLFHVPVGGMLPIILETGGRLTENSRRALSSYIRRDIMGVEDEDKWTPHLLARYNVYWRGLIDAMVVGLVKQVAETPWITVPFRSAQPSSPPVPLHVGPVRTLR